MLQDVDAASAFSSWPQAGHQTGYTIGDGVTTPALVQTLSEDLVADTTYTLTVNVGRRLDVPFQFWQVRLNAVESGVVHNLALTDSTSYAAPSSGGWITVSLAYTPPAGDPMIGKPLQIWLGSFAGNATADDPTLLPGEVDFDNVTIAKTPGVAPPPPPILKDMKTDMWVGADALGRVLPLEQNGGLLKQRRFVGIGYKPWHIYLRDPSLPNDPPYGPWDVTRVETGAPFPSECGAPPNCWPNPPHTWCGRAGPCSTGQFHYWAQPELGYYSLTDSAGQVNNDLHVVRTHARLLAAAMVDFIVIEDTNDVHYRDVVFALLNELRRIRLAGYPTPAVVFWARNAGAAFWWENLYEPNLYPELLFKWRDYDIRENPPTEDPKPLLLFSGFAPPVLTDFNPYQAPFDIWPEQPAMLDNLTIRQSWSDGFGIQTSPVAPEWYHNPTGDASQGRFKWLMESRCYLPSCFLTPEDPVLRPGLMRWGWTKTPGDKEMYPVGVAHHPTLEPNGRSFTLATGQPTGLPGAMTDLGLNFQEQWDHVLGQLTDESRDQAVFQWDWNSWISQAFRTANADDDLNNDCKHDTCGGSDMPCGTPFAYDAPQFGGDGIQRPEAYHVDTYNREWSHDIEPMMGGHTDSYYYQMLANIRRFKGSRALPHAALETGMTVDGSFAEWSTIDSWPDFIKDKGRTSTAQGQHNCSYSPGLDRNDIVEAKAAGSTTHLYFYAKTGAPMLVQFEWDMTLLLDADLNRATGKEGYDFQIRPSGGGGYFHAWDPTTQNWIWQPSVVVEVAVVADQMELRVLRSALGLDPSVLAVDYHWSDAYAGSVVPELGDQAPDRRANFRLVQSNGAGSAAKAPVAGFVGTPLEGVPPLTVAFTDRSAGHRTSWSWTFGDGGTSTLQNPTHVYTAPGAYTVSLTVANLGGSDAETKTAYVRVCAAGGFIVDFLAAPTRGPLTQLAPQKFSVTFSDLSGASSVGASRTWDFGDGTQLTTTSMAPLVHDYTTTGMFKVTLTVGTAAACQVALAREDYVQVYPFSPPPPEVLTGFGQGSGNGTIVRGFFYDEGTFGNSDKSRATNTEFFAYPGAGWGANVAAGLIDNCSLAPCSSASIITGPGPGPALAPHVKAFTRTGTLRASNYSTGTGYGVNVDVGRMDDTDNAEEILTGAGPGDVFGPHVRGWNYDGTSTLQSIAKLNFMAYTGLVYGVNVGSGDIDTGDDNEEILTGPGPGPQYAPQIKGFKYTSALQVVALGKVNYNAYSENAYGAKVKAGDFDGDGLDEQVTARGPSPDLLDGTSLVRGFDGLPPVQVQEKLAFANTEYGANIDVGDLNETGSSAQPDRVIVGIGPDPVELPRVLGLKKGPLLEFEDFPLTGPGAVDFYPFGDSPASRYGGTVASVAYQDRFTFAPGTHVLAGMAASHRSFTSGGEEACVPAESAGNEPADHALAGLRAVAGSLSPEAWREESIRQAALDAIGTLLVDLPRLTPGAVLDRIGSARRLLETGLQNDLARRELLALVDRVAGAYASGRLPSGAVVASIATAGASAKSGHVLATGGFPREVLLAPSSTACPTGCGGIQALSLDGNLSLLLEGSEAPVVLGMSLGGADILVAWSAPADPAACGGAPPGLECHEVLVERRHATDTEASSGPQRVAYALAGCEGPEMAVAVPTRTAGASRAFVSLPPLDPREAGGRVVVVDDVAMVPSSLLRVLAHGTSAYGALAASPLPEDERLFAVHASGIDVLDPATGKIDERVAPVPGHALVAGDTSAGPRLFGLDAAASMLWSLDPLSGATMSATIPAALDLALSADGLELAVATSEAGGTVLALDPASLVGTAIMPVGPFNTGSRDIQAAAEPGTFLVAGEDRVQIVRTARAGSAVRARGIGRLLAALPEIAFAGTDLRAALEASVERTAALLDAAERAPTTEIRDAALEEALRALLEEVFVRMDAGLGGEASDDWIVTTGALEMLAPQAGALADRVLGELSTGKPTVPPVELP